MKVPYIVTGINEENVIVEVYIQNNKLYEWIDDGRLGENKTLGL